MSNPITSAQFTRLLDKRMKEVFENKLKAYSTKMIPTLYNVVPMDSAFDEFYEVGALQDIPEFNGSLSYLSIAPGYYNKIEPKEFAAAVKFERKLLDDKKYRVMENRAGALGESLARTKEKWAARPFINAFSAAFDFQQSEEGVALCSTAHTTKSGTSTSVGFSNSGTSAISKTAIATARINMRKFRNDISELIDVNPDTLLVPDALYDTACEAVGYVPGSGADSDLDPDNANNKVNSQYKRYKVIPWSRLDVYDTNNWFMIDSALMKKFLIWGNRIDGEYNMNVDFKTLTVDNSVYSRFANGFLAWQWIYGNAVS